MTDIEDGILMNKNEITKILDMSVQEFNKLIKQGLPSKDEDKKDFDFIDVIKWRNKHNQEGIEKLVVNTEYNNDDIATAFKCSKQGGMRRSHKTNSLVLVSKLNDKNNIYKDEWHDNELHYTGMGQIGDQKFDQKQNKILMNSGQNKVNIYLFEQIGPNRYLYAGPVALSDLTAPYIDEELDSENKMRKVLKFPIVLQQENYAPSINLLEMKEERLPKNEKELLRKLNKALVKSEKNSGNDHTVKPKRRNVLTKVYDRDKNIGIIARMIADGNCSLCGEPAPFNNKKGEPFLHVHHIDYLHTGGLDVLDNCVAVCPNCHAKIHELEDSKDKEKLLKSVENRPAKYKQIGDR